MEHLLNKEINWPSESYIYSTVAKLNLTKKEKVRVWNKQDGGREGRERGVWSKRAWDRGRHPSFKDCFFDWPY